MQDALQSSLELYEISMTVWAGTGDESGEMIVIHAEEDLRGMHV